MTAAVLLAGAILAAAIVVAALELAISYVRRGLEEIERSRYDR